VNDPERGRDYRLNILRLHDDIWLNTEAFQDALAAAGLNAAGLYATATLDGRPVLCAACHLSEALPGSGRPGIKPLTEAVHTLHAYTADPRNGLLLEDADNRMACYTCHPGSVTRCLRGAMGKAVATDGSMAMQCQSCHGSMTQVGAATRTGWLDEPNCQSCHTGDAVNNMGQIRFTSAFSAPGQLRVATNPRFATTPDMPGPGKSLYRFSTGHGGLQCSACHGSTHAEYPAALPNDNLQSQDHQGHAGVLAECTACHATMPDTVTGGPHGMHPTGNTWAREHGDWAEDEGSTGACQACHGMDYRGTELSRAQGDRVLSTDYGSRTLARGARVSCYLCHNGPDSESPSPNTPPTVAGLSATVNSGSAVTVALPATDPNGNPVTLRVVAQPSFGTVALAGANATYRSDPGYAGPDGFTFSASDGLADSAPGHIAIQVGVADADVDGVPDWWTGQWFGHPTGQEQDQSRAADDPDGDGAANAQEFMAGTDPHRAESVLRLAGATPAPEGVRLRLNTVLGVRYAVSASSVIPAGGWSLVATNVWGHPDSIEILDAAGAGQPRRFYRAQVIP
jgi:hypothetical protein